MTMLALSFACGLLTASLRSASALIFGTLAFAFTLVAASISLGHLSWFLVATFSSSVLAFNGGLIAVVVGELVFAPVRKPDLRP